MLAFVVQYSIIIIRPLRIFFNEISIKTTNPFSPSLNRNSYLYPRHDGIASPWVVGEDVLVVTIAHVTSLWRVSIFHLIHVVVQSREVMVCQGRLTATAIHTRATCTLTWFFVTYKVTWPTDITVAVCNMKKIYLRMVLVTMHKVNMRGYRQVVLGLFHWRFTSSPKYSPEICVLQKSHFLWKFQVETLHVCQGTRTMSQLEILAIKVISGIVYFHKTIFKSLWNINETTPRPFHLWYWKDTHWTMWMRLLKSVLTHLSIQTHCQHWGCRCHLYIHHSAGCQCWPCRYTSHRPHNCGYPQLYQVCNSYNLWEGNEKQLNDIE